MVVAASTPSSWLKFGPSGVAPTHPVAQLVPRVPAHTPRHSSGLQFKVLPSIHHTLPSPAFLAAGLSIREPLCRHQPATGGPRLAGPRALCWEPLLWHHSRCSLHLLHPRGAAGLFPSTFQNPDNYYWQVCAAGSRTQEAIQITAKYRIQHVLGPAASVPAPSTLLPAQ